jgi:integrase
LSAAASKAKLPDDSTAHGLRLARAAALAEVGATAPRIGAWSGHESLQEVSHATAAADRNVILEMQREQNTGNRVAKFPHQPKRSRVYMTLRR